MGAVELPAYPRRGARRGLDKQWLEKLHREGYSGPEPEAPAALSLAIQQFNQGGYRLSHETLEAIWLAEQYPLRLFYHALIKTAVGLLHLERHNRRGATAKLGDVIGGLAPFLPRFMNIDTQGLYRDVTDRLSYVQSRGLVDWKAIDCLPPVKCRIFLSADS